ncbi:LysR family transcriptional regulator [Shewanella sp. D64]|uniref:LysR family transcriptional regulator n=1 Tax=unclassified Shewanella TaxID=196818 RepID=UPI0022BA4EED|nr:MULTISPECIES: LysR family transcriptional regulator [unclassified Shewanella]MEC4725106.1 LysR family transcriptional regulator [Shewanella sp. D64]MEC4737007.1 LysR family transcriptional regulator [Shewanella sp. E94]WBJ96595.1 LysR family transcriptional regulator [Shewanella sp. MTB7]
MQDWIYFMVWWCEYAPMKDWDNYRLILALHRSTTLRGAAERLNVNHSTISRRLALMNKEAGGELFERTAMGYRSTSLGDEFIRAAHHIEQITISSERRKRACVEEMSGEINLSVPPPIMQYLLLDEFKQFQLQYPNIRLNINASFDLLSLDNSDADIVIRGTDHPPDYLIGRRIGTIRLGYYAQKEYLANTTLNARRWIGRNAEEESPQWIKASPFPEVKIGIRSDDIMTRHHLAVAGYGLTRGACFMAEQERELVRISEQYTDYSALWLLTHPDLKETPRIRVLVKFLTACLLEKKRMIEGSG